MEWEKKLIYFLKNFLKEFVIPSYLDNYFDPEIIKIFIKAFTHESFDLEENYEKLEFIGDGMLSSAVKLYLFQVYPYYSEIELTRIYQNVTSNKVYLSISRNLGLSEFLRISPCAKDISIGRVEEDIFESFVGALTLSSEMIKRGLSFVTVYNFILKVFNKFKIIEQLEEEISAVQQIFSRFSSLGIKPPEEIIIEEEIDNVKYYDIELRLNENEIKFLMSKGIKNVPTILAHTKDRSKRKAKSEAYKIAFKKLKDINVTTEWAEKEKKLLEFSFQEVKDYKDRLFKKLEGKYDLFYFFVPKKLRTTEGILVMLIGEKNNKKEIIHQKASKNNKDENKLRLEIIKEVINDKKEKC